MLYWWSDGIDNRQALEANGNWEGGALLTWGGKIVFVVLTQSFHHIVEKQRGVVQIFD